MTDTRLIAGRYELGEMLGYGGMAEVHRARDVRLNRDVAIKLLRSDLARDAVYQERFRREAQSAASLNNPAIVAVYDTGEDAAGPYPVPYIVMEYVAGRTLRDLLNDQERLLPRRALEIISGVLSALDYSHQMGIVHRDIKPGNIMLTRNGTVKVMDFGIARAVNQAQTAAMTSTNAVMGTAQYLSPEQARGEPVDARSDIYATGCLLYELLTGSPPFTGDNAVSVAYQHVREQPVPPSRLEPDVPPDVDAIVLKSLAKNPANRYQSAAEMRADIETALGGRPVRAPAVLPDAPTALIAAGATAGAATATAAATQRILPVETAPVDTLPAAPPRRRWALWVLLAVVALAVLVGAALLVNNLLKGSSGVAVPRVVGLPADQATTMLTDEGLGVRRQPIASDTVQSGDVVNTDPQPGVTVQRGTVVTLYVSSGPNAKAVPQVTGLSLDAATQLLQSQGFQVSTATPKDGSAPANQVLSQDPSSGAQAAPGSTVTLTVASGYNVVPNVIGSSQAAAQQALNSAGFQVNTSTTNQPAACASAPAGTACAIQPSAGQKAQVGSTVYVSIAAAAPSQSASPTPSASPSASASAAPSAASTSPSQKAVASASVSPSHS